MLTKRQNLLETIRGGKPDRFVNQYEAFDCSPSSPFGMIMGRSDIGGLANAGARWSAG